MKETAIALAIITAGSAALAHGGVTNKDVMARMMVMSTLAEQVKVIGTMAKGQSRFDADIANAALIEIAAQSAQITSMFEAQADDPKSEALPAIWEKWDTFAARAMASEQVAEQLAGTVQTADDLGPTLRQLGATCKACHSEFRK